MSGKRGPRSAEVRVSGLLVMLPWLMRQEKVSIAEMAKQFDMNEADLIEDIEMASMCGIPPYTPFELTDMYIDEGFIHVGVNKRFNQNRKLSPSEAFGLGLLAAAAQELPNFSRRRELRSALRKLKRVMRADLVDVDVESSPFISVLSDACQSGERMNIIYWTPSSNQESQRVITARTVFTDRGHWYVSADDDKSGERRTFRIDRVRNVEPTGEFVEVVAEAASVPDWFADASDNIVVVADVAVGATWVVETYPCKVLEERADGSFRIEIVANSAHWLGRLLLRAEGNISVVSPESMVNLQQHAATEVLSLYANNSGN
jgi:proteasome accessory factor C